MAVDFKNSETKDNLMRAFAGKVRQGIDIPLERSRRVKTISRRLLRCFYIPQIRRRPMQRFL